MDMKVSITYKNDRLKALREERGLSQQKLADMADLGVRMLQNYEQGVRDLNGAKLVTLLKLCNALGCRLIDLVTDEEALEQLREYDKR